jgi:hypothetical protein
VNDARDFPYRFRSFNPLRRLGFAFHPFQFMANSFDGRLAGADLFVQFRRGLLDRRQRLPLGGFAF